MSLSEVVNTLEGTHEEVLALVKARTITGQSKIWGADVQKVLASAGLLGLVHDTINTTGVYSGFRDSCIAMSDRFGAGGEINFNDGFTELLMDEFLGNQSVIDIVAASPYVTTQNLRDAVLAQAVVQIPEFPGVTLRDVIAIREPALAAETEVGPINVISPAQVYTLTLTDPLPSVEKIPVEISYDGVIWRSVEVEGLDSVGEVGIYKFWVRLYLLPIITHSSVLRLRIPYAVQCVVE